MLVSWSMHRHSLGHIPRNGIVRSHGIPWLASFYSAKLFSKVVVLKTYSFQEWIKVSWFPILSIHDRGFISKMKKLYQMSFLKSLNCDNSSSM